MTKKVLSTILSALMTVTLYTPVHAVEENPAGDEPSTVETVQEPEAAEVSEAEPENEQEEPAVAVEAEEDQEAAQETGGYTETTEETPEVIAAPAESEEPAVIEEEPESPAAEEETEEPEEIPEITEEPAEAEETVIEEEPDEPEEPEIVEESEPADDEEPAADEEPEEQEEEEPAEEEPEVFTVNPDPVTYNGVTVTVSYPSDTFGGKEVTLVVGEPGEAEKEALEALDKEFKAVDITFVDEEGNPVQPEEGKTVSVTLKAEGMEAADSYTAVHVDAEGKIDYLDAQTETSNEVTEQIKTGENTRTVYMPAETETVVVEDYRDETYTDYETRQTTVEVPAEISYRQVLRSREVEKKETVVSLLKRLLTVPGKNNRGNTKTVTEYYYEPEPYVVREAYTNTITETVPVTRTRRVLAGTHTETRVIREAYSYEAKDDIFEEITTNDVETAFEAKSFSVYAVVAEGAVEDNSRLTVNFISNDETIATMYVKNADSAADINTIIYDPGVGELDERQVFQGWSLVEDYSAETASYTVDQIRQYIAGLPDWAEGDVLNIYARIFKTYSVTYLGPNNVSYGSDAVMLPVDDTKVNYTVTTNYEPETDTEMFRGWNPIEGSSNITGYESGTLYPLGTSIEISGDITFSISVANRHWLVFNQNGKGATYNAPRFYQANEHTSSDGLLPMQRYGYTFGGWYTDAACTDGNEYQFGELLEDHRTIYAKWTPVQTAPYVVIIWKQNVNDNKNAADSAKTYDFAESITLSGNVGTTVNTISATGTGNNRYASVDGAAKRYTGFHLNKYDTNVTITPEGTAVVNVYYDRNLVTLTFRYRQYYIFSSEWITQETMTGLYGSSITGNGYTWPTNRWWYDSYTSSWGIYYGAGTRTTFLDAFIISDGSDSQTFYGFDGAGTNSVYFYKKNGSGEGYTLTNTVTSSNGTFYITDKFNGYKAVSYSTNNSTWTNLGEKDSDGVYASVSVSNTDLYVRYDPLLYNILYMDGVYLNGDNNPVPGYESRGELNQVEGIPYDSSVASYNKGGADYYEPTYAGFTFEGWYIDDACTQPYTFTNMPEGIKVYAKWRQNQYRVFMHPNVPNTDTTLNWGSATQAMNFRVSNGAKVSLPIGTRSEYTFVGWYTDPGLHNVYPASTELYDDTPYLAPYDKTVDMTDPMDKYGEGATSNGDVNRPWITQKLDLYAKWSAILIGAEGIGVRYDENGGTNPPSDTTLYKDNVDAVAQGASTAPSGKQFEYWIVQKWNGTEYVDTTTHVYPGDTFRVLKENAQVVENPDSTPENPSYTYTVQLKAFYIDLDAPTNTYFNWYKNDVNPSQLLHEDKDLQINEARDIYTLTSGIPTREGYKFLGWARETEYEVDGDNKPTGDAITYHDVDEDDLYLKWVEADPAGSAVGHYEAQNESGTWVTVTQVAADEIMPYQAWYAVWTLDHFFIFHSATGDLEAVEYIDSIDLTAKVTNGYLYGGYYEAYAGYEVTDQDKANAEKSSTLSVHVTDNVYNPAANASHVGYWNSSNAYTASGTEMAPEVKTVYYLKEVPASYLRPTYMTTYQRWDKYLRDFILISTTDDQNYTDAGFVIGSTYTTKEYFTQTVDVTFGPNYDETVTDGVVTLSVANTSANAGGYVVTKRIFSVDEGTMSYSGILGSKLYKIYWVTPDGITVTGAAMRMFTVKDKDGDNIIKVVPVTPAGGGAEVNEITYSDFSTAIKAQKR